MPYLVTNSVVFDIIKTRIVPYVSFGLLTYFIWLLQMLLKKYNIYDGTGPVPDSFLKPLIGMIYGNGIDGWLMHNTMLWFLACLLITELFFLSVTVFVKDRNLLILTLVSFSILGYLDSLYSPIRLFFSINVSFTALVFYGFGFILKDYFLQKKQNIVIPIFLLLIGMAFGLLNGRIDMNGNRFGNYFLFYLSSFSSICAYIFLIKKMSTFRPISYIGKNSLIFFLLQNQAFLAVNIIFFILTKRKVGSIEDNFLVAIIYVLASIVILFPASYFINSKVSIITGKKIKHS